MFNNPRYLTIGVQTEIPIMVQAFIWNCIGRLPDDADYLQVFVLKPFGNMQEITYTSEEPEYKKVYIFPSDNPITEKLYVIDSDEYSTMLLASEY
jgi:hypothetical protein